MSKTISCSGRSTSGMISHVKSCWNIQNLLEESENDRKRQKTFAKKKIGCMISKLMACDGFSAFAISKSETLHSLFNQCGYEIPQVFNQCGYEILQV